ncbi:hypothetical protein MUK42_19583 [Musa troglodytarum]|uniref:Uncharacterized protein n=1 Tax=Musa troglodytarum TaxID=320322 RepID=A0A9E7K1F2_9LILI|nr:hypothetical protein MUK42_19583 [Musa troglodytarum]
MTTYHTPALVPAASFDDDDFSYYYSFFHDPATAASIGEDGNYISWMMEHCGRKSAACDEELGHQSPQHLMPTHLKFWPHLHHGKRR